MGQPKRVDAVELLRARLDELGWNQTDLSEEIGVSAAVVSRVLAGLRKPSLEMALRLQAHPISLPADAWLGGHGRTGTEG